MKLFVYGTLKMGGINHDWYLYNSKFLKHHKMKGFTLLDIGHGFPYMVKSSNSKDVVFGELYEVSESRILKIDMLEGVPHLYQRQYTENIYYYLSTMDLNIIETLQSFKTLDYWKINDEKVKFNVYVDGRQQTDIAQKIIFHMRFFDGERAPTNKDYMELLKARSGLDLNTDSDAVFLRDCIIRGIVEEYRKPLNT